MTKWKILKLQKDSNCTFAHQEVVGTKQTYHEYGLVYVVLS